MTTRRKLLIAGAIVVGFPTVLFVVASIVFADPSESVRNDLNVTLRIAVQPV
jgi:hypothetical protein